MGHHAAYAADAVVLDVSTDRVAYDPEETVQFSMSVWNHGDEPVDGRLHVNVQCDADTRFVVAE